MWRSSATSRGARRRALSPAARLAGTIGLGALLLSPAPAACSDPGFCLPPLYEDGSRLVSADETRVLWLEPLLRQHEVCWREPASAGESRVFVLGSSGIFGYPYSAKDTAVAMVNRSLAAERTPAHLFNLGMMWTYGPKDALILHEARRFRPDAIVYAVTLDDFYHSSPSGFTPVDTFFLSNSRAVDRAAAASLPGIGAPLELYRRHWSEDAAGESLWRSFRESGRLARIATRQVALRARSSWLPDMPAELAPIEAAGDGYDCEAVKRYALHWINWQDWSLLPWLEQMQREHGTRVLVVNWPVAPEPVGDCFNARYPKANFDAYNAWLERETRARGLRYADLHDLVPKDRFLDSIHPNAEGQRAVAARLEQAVRDLLAGPPETPGALRESFARPPQEP
jgi:hypothetical protein